MPFPHLLIANSDSKRCQAFCREFDAFCSERDCRPSLGVVPWNEIIPRDGNLDGIPAFLQPALVRLESPGRDFEVQKLLLEAGSRAAGEPAGQWKDLRYRKGQLVRPGLLYQGFRRVLEGLATSFAARPHLHSLACPRAVAELFDKNATSARLAANGISCPPSLNAPATSSELLELLRARRIQRAYVKLNTGSSASCIAVVDALDEPAWAFSSVVRLDGGFFSTRRLQRYEGEDLSAVLDFILREGACVQEGIPMAQIDGQNFDVRVVMIYGQPAFTVFRLSGQPMTNLHFGGRRGNSGQCRAAIPNRAWLDAMDQCVEAAKLYDCAMVGIDLLFERNFLRHYILEVNAFGDFFPGLTDSQGRSVHRVEIESTAEREDFRSLKFPRR